MEASVGVSVGDLAPPWQWWWEKRCTSEDFVAALFQVTRSFVLNFCGLATKQWSEYKTFHGALSFASVTLIPV